MSTTEHRSPIFHFADELVDRLAESDPIFASFAGVAGHDDRLNDFSDAQRGRDVDQFAQAMATLATLEPHDDVDRVAKEYLRERLGIQLELLDTDEIGRTFSVINSPLGAVRQVFELMTLESAADAAAVRARLEAVRPCFESWRERAAGVAAAGRLPNRRHVEGLAEQTLVTAGGAFADFAERAADATGVDVDASGLRAAALDAQAAASEIATWLAEDLAPRATAPEACGAERYERWVRYWTGATIDLVELYAWGYQDLRRIRARMDELAAILAPDAPNLVAVADVLNHDPARTIEGTDALLTHLKDFTAATVATMDGVHFDIDERITFCDARLAPEGSAAAPYYIGPSEDLSRPGTTWFPTLGETSFHWWTIKSTWYHEGVPGHHLQIATALLSADRQTRYHRLADTPSGYTEGWALYAERLMDELGFFEDPAEELGFLSAQALRAARVVVDIGLHLELDAPADFGELRGLGDVGGTRWTPEMAVAVLEEWVLESPEFARSEVDRYLGMPAQALSYKLGERAWLAAREAARERLGDAFDLKRFHAHALTTGPLGLDTFAVEMAKWDGA